MTERTKVSVSWLVTVVMVPVIGFSGIRLIVSVDEIDKSLQEVRIEQAVTNQRLLLLEVIVRKP